MNIRRSEANRRSIYIEAQGCGSAVKSQPQIKLRQQSVSTERSMMARGKARALWFDDGLGEIPRPVHVDAVLQRHEVCEELQRHDFEDG